MKRFYYFLLVIFLVSACSVPPPSPTSNPTSSPIPPAEKPTTPSATLPSPTQTPLPLREIPMRFPPMAPLPASECPFVPNVQIEKLIGAVIEAPVTTVTFQPPYYENRASILCEARSKDNAIFADLWFSPDEKIAQSDFDEVEGLLRGEAIPVKNLGERALWWQNGLRLEVVAADARLTISLASSIEDQADQTALLAARILEAVFPENGLTQPEEILVTDTSVPESIFLRDLIPEGEFFEACSLLPQNEYENVFGTLNFPLKSRSAIGELEPFEMFDCTTDSLEPGGWMYFSVVFGKTPSEMILHYRRGAITYPLNATPMQNVGDEAWYWSGADGANLNLSVLRGNIMLVINVLRADSYESRGQIRSLARIILGNLFEPHP